MSVSRSRHPYSYVRGNQHLGFVFHHSFWPRLLDPLPHHGHLWSIVVKEGLNVIVVVVVVLIAIFGMIF